MQTLELADSITLYLEPEQGELTVSNPRTVSADDAYSDAAHFAERYPWATLVVVEGDYDFWRFEIDEAGGVWPTY